MDWRREVDRELLPLIPTAGPALGDLALDDLFGLYEQRRKHHEIDRHPNVERVDVAWKGVHVTMHRPRTADRPVAAIFDIHGGGFFVGSSRMDESLLDHWAHSLPAVCAAVDYRLSPEAHYPAALDDCISAFSSLLANVESLGIDSACTGVYGASAGAALAVGMTLRLRGEGRRLPAFLLLDCPSLDDRQETPSSGWDVPIAGPSTVKLHQYSWLQGLLNSE